MKSMTICVEWCWTNINNVKKVIRKIVCNNDDDIDNKIDIGIIYSGNAKKIGKKKTCAVPNFCFKEIMSIEAGVFLYEDCEQ